MCVCVLGSSELVKLACFKTELTIYNIIIKKHPTPSHVLFTTYTHAHSTLVCMREKLQERAWFAFCIHSCSFFEYRNGFRGECVCERASEREREMSGDDDIQVIQNQSFTWSAVCICVCVFSRSAGSNL